MMRRLGLLIAMVSMLGCGSREEPSFRPARARAEDRAEGEAARPTPAQAPAPSPQEAQIPEGIVEAGPTVTEVQAANPGLLDPSRATARAPAVFTVELDTSEGPVHLEVHRDWSPNGADRFFNLVNVGFFTDVAFFRVVDGFMAQTGIHGRPDVAAAWRSASIPDDPVVQHNTRGFVSFAMAGPNTRTTQFFINLVDNQRLDPMGFPPFARVWDADMATVDRLYDGYGESAPSGRGPTQARIQTEGNAYLRAGFPELDYIRSARIVPNAAAQGRAGGAPR